MITAKTMHEALKNKDYETCAQLYVERMAMKAVKADLAEAVKKIKEFTPTQYRLLLDILEGK
jgi:hypothetical protein